MTRLETKTKKQRRNTTLPWYPHQALYIYLIYEALCYIQLSVRHTRYVSFFMSAPAHYPSVRSAVKKNTLEPVWNEIHQFKVYDCDSESLNMVIFDKDDLLKGGDEKIGTVTMPLSMLEDGKCRAVDAQPMDMTGLKHGRQKKFIDNPPTLRFELLYVPFGASDEDITVPEEWEIPPSGVLRVHIMRSTKLPVAKIAKLLKPPHVELKLGHMVQTTKAANTISETVVGWNEELTFIGVDLETTPRLELKLCGLRSSMASKIQSKMQSAEKLRKDLADVGVNLAGVVSSGGRMQQKWHWNNIDSGDVEMKITFARSEAVDRLRKARWSGGTMPSVRGRTTSAEPAAS